MALNNYIPTVWVKGSIPAINAVNLNKMEAGIDAVTDEVIDLRTNPTKASETVLGVVKMWTTTSGGLVTGHFEI